MTITLDEAIYRDLYRQVGRRKMSQFIEDAVRPLLTTEQLDAEYAEMARDSERNAEVALWDAASDADLANEADRIDEAW